MLYGSGSEPIPFVYEDGVRSYKTEKPFEGVIGNIERRWKETDIAWVREELARFQSDHPCDVCGGYRLKPQALAVKIAGLHIGEVQRMSIKSADQWFRDLPEKLDPKAEGNRRPGAEGNPRAAEIPQRRRARLSHSCPQLRHVVGR